MKKTLTLRHNQLSLMGWPVGSQLLVDSKRKPREYDVVQFVADGVHDIGIYRPAPCGRCASFIGARTYEPRDWKVLGVALYRLPD